MAEAPRCSAICNGGMIKASHKIGVKKFFKQAEKTFRIVVKFNNGRAFATGP